MKAKTGVIARVVLVASAVVTAVGSARGAAEAVRRPGCVFGILQHTPANSARNHAAGARMGHMSLHWNRYYPAEGVRDSAYVADKQAELRAMREVGFDIMLDLGLQYPPAWVYEMPDSRFVNQYGDAYVGGVGETGVNAVFNDHLRQQQAAYVRDVLAVFGADVDIVRLGFMRYSEIGYPHPTFKGRTNAYWAYDAIAQGMRPGLPAGVPPCPVPGWVPGTSNGRHEDARRFLDWYIRALKHYHDWQIDLVGGLFEGRMAMLYPSWGIRGDQREAAILTNLAGDTPAERNGEIQRAFDFKLLIEGINNPRVMVCGTWVDANPIWSDDDAPFPRNPSPIHYLAELARRHPLKLGVMGENTGGGGIAAMNLTFARAARHRLEILMWAFESHLYDGQPPTLDDFAERVRTFEWGESSLY